MCFVESLRGRALVVIGVCSAAPRPLISVAKALAAKRLRVSTPSGYQFRR